MGLLLEYHFLAFMNEDALLCRLPPTEDAVYYETEYMRKAGEEEERSRVAETGR